MYCAFNLFIWHFTFLQLPSLRYGFALCVSLRASGLCSYTYVRIAQRKKRTICASCRYIWRTLGNHRPVPYADWKIPSRQWQTFPLFGIRAGSSWPTSSAAIIYLVYAVDMIRKIIEIKILIISKIGASFKFSSKMELLKLQTTLAYLPGKCYIR